MAASQLKKAGTLGMWGSFISGAGNVAGKWMQGKSARSIWLMAPQVLDYVPDQPPSMGGIPDIALGVPVDAFGGAVGPCPFRPRPRQSKVPAIRSGPSNEHAGLQNETEASLLTPTT